MRFDYTYTPEVAGKADPVYENKAYGDVLPKLQLPSNITYPQLMLLMGNLWETLHPEISFVPFGGSQKYNPERGYIVYTLDHRRPAQDNTKKRVRDIIIDPNNDLKKYQVFTQTFDNLISFTAIHKDPIVAEELIESFEDFMTQVTPILLQNGVEKIMYNRRTHDEHVQRYGDDVAARVIIYMMQLQKILIAEMDVLNAIAIRAQNYVHFILDESNQATPNVKVEIYDNYATPNT